YAAKRQSPTSAEQIDTLLHSAKFEEIYHWHGLSKEHVYPPDELQLKLQNCYILSNDEVHEINPGFSPVAIIGICNPHLLHVISSIADQGIDIKRLVAFDINIEQIRHFLHIIRLIRKSCDRIDFIEELLFVKFGQRAKELLQRYCAPGGVVIKGWAPDSDPQTKNLEFELWDNTEFDSVKFTEFYGVKAWKTGRGLYLTDIKTVGEHNKGCVTVFSGDSVLYPEGPFMLSFGYGYLKSEDSFMRLREFLKSANFWHMLSIRCGSMFDVLGYSLKELKYYNIVTWTSNVFAPYFVSKLADIRAAYSLIIDQVFLSEYSSRRICSMLISKAT
ncbi:unnamed protein product, partial [marine sediment metagenome]